MQVLPSLFDKNSSIVITGGTGFAGSHLVEYLLEQKITKDALHVTSHSGRKGYVHTLLPQKNIHTVDLLQKESIDALLKKIQPTHIFHLASISAVDESFTMEEEVIEKNVQLQKNLLTSLQEYTPKSKMLHVSSAAIYASSNKPLTEDSPIDPTSPYAESKQQQEKLCKNSNATIIIARSFNHIGERQSANFVIPAFAKQIVAIEQDKQDILRVGNLTTIRDFTDVKDIVKAYVLLMQKGENHQVYNIGSKKGYSIQQMLDMMVQLSHSEMQIYVDESKVRSKDVSVRIADNTKIKKLGWKVKIPIEQTLQRVIDYWRNI